MKKIKYLLIIYFAFNAIGLSAQTNDTLWGLPPGYFVETVRNTYDTLSHEGMETGLLLNRGMVFTDYTEEWYKGEPVIASAYEWIALYNGIKDSDIDGILELPPDSIFNDYSKINIYGVSTIALGILNFNVDYLSQEAINKIMKEPGIEPDYSQFRLFSGSVLHYKIYNGLVSFFYTPELYFSNLKENSEMFVDFEDGMGYRQINLTKKSYFKVKYKITGEKSIRFKLIEGADTLISYSKISVKDLGLPAPTSKTDPNITLDNAYYYYLEGNDNELNKPVIFIEGFDIEGTESAEDLYTYWKNTQIELSERGYDCFFVNMNSPGLSVITNVGQTIQELIQGVNEAKIGHHEIVIVGESMGGLITRIALKNLENQGYDHQCRLYVSYDSPHKGANIPPGVQYLVYRVHNILQPYPLQFNILTEIMSTIFGLISANYSAVYSKLMSEGAQEMLVNHISGYAEFNDLQDFLTELGFPENSRNVAFANGSNTGIHQGIVPGSPFFPEISTPTFPFRTAIECKYSGVNQNHMVFGVTIKLWFFGWNTILEIGDYYTFDEKFYADAPAGYVDNNNDMDFRIAFLPIVSAIDLNQELIDLYNLDYFIIDENHPKEDYINNNEVPFDDIYSDTENTKHTRQTVGLNIPQNFEEYEVMFDNMHLQNRIIDNTRDFEASDMIMAGRNVTPGGWGKTIDINDFVIADGGDVTFTAGETIRLEAGFIVEPGGHFSAHIDNNLKNKNGNNLTPIPEIAGNKYAYIQNIYFVQNSNKNDLISWRLTGENTDIYSNCFSFEIPANLNCGQYTLYCTKTGKTGSATHTKVIEVSSDSKHEMLKQFVNPVMIEAEKIIELAIKAYSEKVNIFPNPNSGRFVLQIEDINIGHNFSVEILDFSGKPVKQYLDVFKFDFQIDISDLAKGIYFVKIQAGDKTYMEKVVYR